VVREQGSPCNCHSVPDLLSWLHGGSVLSPVRNTVFLQCFDAVEVLGERPKTQGIQPVKVVQQQFPELKFTFGDRPNLE